MLIIVNYSQSFDERRRRIRQMRRGLGFTQEHVAKLAGITQESLSGFERGKHDLSPQTYTRVERAIFAATRGQDRIPDPGALPGARLAALAMPPDEYEAWFAREWQNWKSIQRVQTMQHLIESQSELIDVYTALIEKDARIAELEKQVAELRSLYDAETEAALAYDKARELRAQVEGEEHH
jgi:transcriptional regulator with XRE-family HTH domain